jgi:hypothetical protein
MKAISMVLSGRKPKEVAEQLSSKEGREEIDESVGPDTDYHSYCKRYQSVVDSMGRVDGKFVGLKMSRPDFLRTARVYHTLSRAYEDRMDNAVNQLADGDEDQQIPSPPKKMAELESKLLY